MAAAIVPFAVRQAPDLPELGTPGTQFLRGFLKTEEYVPELQGSKALDVFERMRRSDGMVKAVLGAMKLPILAAEWSVAPGSDAPTASGQDVARHLARNLFKGMSMTWRASLRDALTHLDFGFHVCEIVWHTVERDGRVWYELKKLAPRLQRTIYKWNLADDGGLETITQQVFSGSTFDTVDIPVDKLLVFTHEKEGANWIGVSALRPAYKHWWMKDQAYRFQMIAGERHAAGIPVVELPEGKDDPANVLRAEDIAIGVRTHERAYVVLPFGYKFRFEGLGSDRVFDLQPAIEHHDRAIGLSMLAHHLALGAKREGSNALSGDQSSFFMLAEKAVAQDLADIFNRYLIPQWVRFNYGEVEDLPELRFGRIETRGLDELFNALATVAGQMLVTPDDILEAALRDMAGLPPHDPTTARKRATPAPAPQPQPKGTRPGTEPPPMPVSADGGDA